MPLWRHHDHIGGRVIKASVDEHATADLRRFAVCNHRARGLYQSLSSLVRIEYATLLHGRQTHHIRAVEHGRIHRRWATLALADDRPRLLHLITGALLCARTGHRVCRHEPLGAVELGVAAPL